MRVETEIPEGTLPVAGEQITMFSFVLHIEGKQLLSGVGAGTKFSQLARRFSLFQRFAPEILVFLDGLCFHPQVLETVSGHAVFSLRTSLKFEEGGAQISFIFGIVKLNLFPSMSRLAVILQPACTASDEAATPELLEVFLFWIILLVLGAVIFAKATLIIPRMAPPFLGVNSPVSGVIRLVVPTSLVPRWLTLVAFPPGLGSVTPQLCEAVFLLFFFRMRKWAGDIIMAVAKLEFIGDNSKAFIFAMQ